MAYDFALCGSGGGKSMRRLYLLRHAKSSWADPGLADFDRPLNRRGQEAAPRMGKYMREEALEPDLVLCSAARRAQETWELVARELDKESAVKVQRSLYLATPSRLLATINRQASEVEGLLLVGHNPGMETLSARLAGAESKRKAVLSLQEKFPTATLAVFDCDIADWSDLEEGGGRLVRLVKPRELG